MDQRGRIGRAIQGLILFSAILGALFLWEASGLLPASVFDIIAVGWALFVVDGVLSFVRPAASYYLGLVLAVLALSASLPQPTHYTFFAAGEILAGATFTAGTAAQFALIALVAYYAVAGRRYSSRAADAGQSG